MPPPARRRLSPDEDLQARIDALSPLDAPPSLGQPRMDARDALLELRALREQEAAAPPPDEGPPPAATAPAPAGKPSLDELLRRFPPLPVQRPVPPKPSFDGAAPVEPAPEPEPVDPGVRHALANYVAASKPPAEPTYVPPPEQPVEDVPPQEMGPPSPEPEDVVASASRALSDYSAATETRAPPPEGQAAEPAQALAPGKAPPPEARRDYSDVAGRVASTPQRGPNPDPFGHDDDGGFTRAEAIRQARAAYDRQSTQGGRHWEDEFLASNPRMGNQEFQRRSIALGLFGGYDRMREAQQDRRAEQQQYATGLAQARMRDQGEGRISRAQAEAIAATGQVSPEAAAAMRLNDPLLKQFGQFASQGGRAEHLDYQRDKMMNELHTKIALQEELLKSLEKRQGMKDETQKAVADKYAARRKAEKSEDVLTTDDKRVLISSILHSTYRDKGLTLPVAREAAMGVFSNVPEALRERVEADTGGMSVFKTRGDFRTAAMGTTAAGAKGNIAAENAERTARTTIQLKPQQIKENKDITILAADVRRAAQAWSKMPQSARDAYVQNGRNMPEAIKSKALGQYQVQAGDLEKLVGQIRRTTLGLAQTIPELDGLATEMGKAADTWDPFKGSGAFERAMERVMEEMRLRKRLLNNLSKPGGQ